MVLFFFSPSCPLRPTTNRIFDIRVCDNLAKCAAKIEFVAPNRRLPYNIKPSQIRSHYGIESDVKVTIQRTPLFSARHPKTIEAFVLLVANLFSTIRILFTHRKELADVVFLSRSPILLLQPILIRRLLPASYRYVTLLFLHEVKSRRLHKWTYRHVDGLVAISPQSKVAVESLGIPPERSVVFYSPIPDSLLTETYDRDEIRRRLGLDDDSRPLVVYTGKLYRGQREIRLILEAAAQLPECRFLFTGGSEPVVNLFQRFCRDLSIRNVIFTGFIDDATCIKDYQRVADVLVSYYTKDDHDLAFNFPQKIAEYMASGNPIVTPDHPATRGVLDESNAIFVEPEDPRSLAEGIRRAAGKGHRWRAIADQAKADAKTFTYSRQTRLLIDFVTRLLDKRTSRSD